MSGKRMVSSVQITLAPPWRGETSQKIQTPHHQEHKDEPAHLQTDPLPPPPSYPTEEQSWSEPEEYTNGDMPSFPPTFLDDIPTEDDYLGADLPPPPPPPPPPVFLKSPKRVIPDPIPPSHPDALSLELQKLDLVHSPSFQKPNSAPPAPYNPVKSTSIPSNQRKTEDPMPSKPSQNGYTAKQESGDICAFCHKTILPSAAAIEAMKKQYHASCFTCRKCHRLLAGQLYYQKDGQPICDHCYKDTLEKCAKCQTLIMQHIVRAMGNGYHPECFTCVVCQRRIADESFAVDEYNDVHCADDYYRKYAPICNVCNKPIIPRDGQDSYKIECLGRNYHENCYRCERCHVTLSLEPTDSGCYPLKDHLLCKSCHLKWKDEFS